MPRPQQLSLPAFQARLIHGGDTRAGRRKLARPLDPRRPLHLVLRSSRARGAWSLLHPRNERKTRALAHRLASRFGVRLLRLANAGNHLHLVIKAPHRQASQNYLRSLAGMLARTITGARKGRPVGRFWDALAFSRVLARGRDLQRTVSYLITNELEGLGWNEFAQRRNPDRRRDLSERRRP